MVITSNGKPVAILTSTSKDMLEESLAGEKPMSLKDINKEIQAYRQNNLE